MKRLLVALFVVDHLAAAGGKSRRASTAAIRGAENRELRRFPRRRRRGHRRRHVQASRSGSTITSVFASRSCAGTARAGCSCFACRRRRRSSRAAMAGSSTATIGDRGHASGRAADAGGDRELARSASCARATGCAARHIALRLHDRAGQARHLSRAAPPTSLHRVGDVTRTDQLYTALQDLGPRRRRPPGAARARRRASVCISAPTRTGTIAARSSPIRRSSRRSARGCRRCRRRGRATISSRSTRESKPWISQG